MQMNSVTQTGTIVSQPNAFDLRSSQTGTDAQKTPFADLFKSAMENMQQLENKASTAVQGLLDGSGVNVHTAMIATSNADAAFELSLAVRNKAVGAFQQLMNMQF